MQHDKDFEQASVSAHAFARLHGLASRYDAQDPREVVQSMKKLPSVGDDDFHGSLAKSAHLTAGFDWPVQAVLEERLDVHGHAARLLFETTKPPQDGHCVRFIGADDDVLMRKSVPDNMRKLSLPLLRTDDEIDVLRLQRISAVSIRQATSPSLWMDEGSTQGDVQVGSPIVSLQFTLVERLEIPRDSLIMLKCCMADEWTDSIVREDRRSPTGHSKRRKFNPVTPPLSPVAVAWEFPSAPSRLCDPQHWSDVTGKDDGQTFDSKTGLCLYEELEMPVRTDGDANIFASSDDGAWFIRSSDASSFPIVQCASLGKGKIEVPLLPRPDHDQGHFEADEIRHSGSMFDPELLLWSGQTTDALQHPSDALAPFACNANLTAEQEQLLDKDARLRVDVPQVEPLRFVSPWNTCPTIDDVSSAEDETPLQLQSQEDWRANAWSVGSVLTSSLIWLPFPSKIVDDLDRESIDDAAFIADIMNCLTMTDVVTSNSEAWKPDGLRVCHDLFNDELLEQMKGLSDGEGIENLIRQRITQLPSDVTLTGKTMEHSERNMLHDSTRQTSNSRQVMARSHVQRFFAARGIHVRSREAQMAKSRPTIDADSITEPFCDTTCSKNEVSPGEPLTLPSLPSDLPPRSFLVSLNLIRTQRGLFQRLRVLYPNAEYMERDFDLHSSSSSSDLIASRYAPCHTHDHVDSAEADIVLCPSTGLVLTTLQKIQQTSLPGALPQINIFHDRLIALAAKYERLVILVSQNIADSSRPHATHSPALDQIGSAPAPLAADDTCAMADLTALASHLPAQITAQLILGGERELASWAVYHMSRAPGPYLLPHEESHWERTLRRAGMNAFAACFVLAHLSQSGGADVASSSEQADRATGLSAFISMDSKERIRQFAEVFGGENVLARINAGLERTWISGGRGHVRRGSS